MDQPDKFLNNTNMKNSCDINIYNIKKEDVIIKENMNINNNSSINIYNNDQVNIYIENSDLNKKVYNCYTCNIQIYNYSFFRYHFKSEWHKYNIKRKLLNLNSVNEITFNEKLESFKKSQEKKEANSRKKNNNIKIKEKKSNIECYNNKKNNNTNDINKIKYATKEAALLKKNVKYDNPLVCFFDNRIFNTIEENIKHMYDDHTFCIPDEKYVVDLKQIILSIGKKIYEENMCIYCFKYSKCVKSIQAHMKCKSHTKLHKDFYVFVEKYYDFSKSYVDLLNRYIQNKEDKEYLLYMLRKKKREEITSKCHVMENKTGAESDGNDSLSCVIKESAKKNKNLITNEKIYGVEEEANNKVCKSQKCYLENSCNVKDSAKNEETDNTMLIDYRNNSLNSDCEKNVEDNNDDTSNDFKVKEEDLNKNLSHDVIYEILEHFGYNKPEINEYDNLVLPDGSEAINRKIAYIFKQKLPLENISDCNKIDLLKKKEISLKHREYKYYIDYIKKYNLNLNLKTNKLNKFYKSDTLFFI